MKRMDVQFKIMSPMKKIPKMTAGELEAKLMSEFPQGKYGKRNRIEAVGPMTARVRMTADERNLRPGGTVSGPTLMGLADGAVYVAILAHIGWVPLAVTTSFSINFLKKPAPGDIIADCRLIKLGKRLAVGEVALRSEGDDELVAHCVATYSIPPNSGLPEFGSSK
jgi:uncharacterized protein (TIGR00369 family)